MNNKILVLMAGTALAVAACAKHDNANTSGADTGNADLNMTTDNGAMGNSGATATTTTAPAPTTAQGFVNAAAASDKFEIESSKLAATAGSSAAVKRFATQMISAHTASTAKLKSTVAGMSPPLTPDDTLTPDQQQKLDSLKGLNGAAFDSAYKTAQTEAHQKTLDTLRAYSTSGDNAALKALASKMIPTVTAHLNIAMGLK
jgi:putative membrane protein